MSNGFVSRVVLHGGLILAVILSAGCSGSPEESAPVVPVVISIDDGSVVEGDAGQVDLVFDVSLSDPAVAVVTIDYATNGGSATTQQGRKKKG